MADSDQQFWPNQVRETIKAADFVVEIKMIDLLDRHGNFSAKLDKNKFDIVFTDETEESVTLTIKKKSAQTGQVATVQSDKKFDKLQGGILPPGTFGII